LLAHGWWFSPASSTTKTGRHDITGILLKVALNTKNQIISHVKWNFIINPQLKPLSSPGEFIQLSL
jgi:hypothetical protein